MKEQEAAEANQNQVARNQLVATRVFWLLLGLQALLLPISRGEFWPFSIFPMFSGAGKDWSRAVVTKNDDGLGGGSRSLSAMTQPVVPLDSIDVHQNDLSATLSRTSQANGTGAQALRKVFSRLPVGDVVILNMVRGQLVKDQLGNPQVQVTFEPQFRLSRSQIEVF